MTKAVSHSEICVIKALLLLCEHGHLKKIENGEKEKETHKLCTENYERFLAVC